MATRLQAGDIWLDGEGGKWIGIPVSTLRRPHAGRLVKAPASWIVVTKGACAWAVFYKTYGSPQCNPNPALSPSPWRVASSQSCHPLATTLRCVTLDSPLRHTTVPTTARRLDMRRELNVVSGRSASGKTTVARVIAETLAALGIEVDVLAESDDTKELAARRLPGILGDGVKVTVSTRSWRVGPPAVISFPEIHGS